MQDENVDPKQEETHDELKSNPGLTEDVDIAQDMAITEDELRSLDPKARRAAYIGKEVSGTDSEHRLSSGPSSDEVYTAEERRKKEASKQETSGSTWNIDAAASLQNPLIFVHGPDADNSAFGPNSKEAMRLRAEYEMTDRRFSDRLDRTLHKEAQEEIVKAQANGIPVEQSHLDEYDNQVTIEGRKVPLGRKEVDPVVAAANLKERERNIESRALEGKRPLNYTEAELRSHKQLDEEVDRKDYDRVKKDAYYGKSRLGRVIKGRILGRGERPRELN